jgi:hypothetical protein
VRDATGFEACFDHFPIAALCTSCARPRNLAEQCGARAR